MVKLYCGRAGCGKSEKIFEQVLLGTQEKRRQILIVPEMLSHEAERRLLKTCGNQASHYAEVVSFKRIATKQLRAKKTKTPLLDSGGRVLAMYRAVKQAEASLTYYKTAFSRPEMIEKLALLTNELKACLVSPEALMKAGEKAGDASGKFCDIALIYAAYCNITASLGLDDKDLIGAACDLLRKNDSYQGYDIYFDGFSGFTAQEYELCEILLSRANSVSFSLLLDRGDTIFEDQERMASRLREMASRYGAAFEEITMIRSSGDQPSLDFLEQHLLGYGEAVCDLENCAVHVVECESRELECAVAAAKIRELVANGARYREITVAAGNMDQYAATLETQFEKFEVPVFLSEKSDILAKPVMSALVSALTAVSQNMSYDSVFTYLKSGLSFLEPSEVDLLENYVLTWNIRGRDYFSEFTKNPFGFDISKKDEGDELLPKIEAIRARLDSVFTPLATSLRACTVGQNYAAALEAFLVQSNLEQKIEMKIDALEKNERKREAAQYAQLFDIIKSCLEQFASSMRNVAVDSAEFLRLWRLMLAQYSVSSIPVTLDCVQAGSFDRLSFSNVQHLIVVGAVDGDLPPAGVSRGLFTERDRVALSDLGIELTQSAEEHAFEKQSQIYRGFASAKSSVTVTYPLQVSGGKTRKSYLLQRIFGIFPSLTCTKPSIEYMLTAKRPSFELACISVSSNSEVSLETARQIALENPQNAAFFDMLRKYCTNSRGPINSKDLIAKAYGKDIHMTASRAEKIASCRFSYFMQYGLRARERKVAKFGAPETGTMLHYVVEKSINELSARPSQNTRDVAMKFMDEYISTELSGLSFQPARVIALFNRMRRMVATIVDDVWAELCASRFKPISFEMTFAKGGENSVVSLNAGDVSCTLSGQIDRVDGFIENGTLYLKVVDYKTGQKSFHISDVLAGLNMQMFIYLLMLGGGENTIRQQATAVLGEDFSATQTAGILYIPAKTPFVAANFGDLPADIQQRQHKDIRRIGLVLDDEKIIRALENGDDFKYLPVSFKKDGTISANSSVASQKGFDQLICKTDRVLKQLARQIANGDIEAEPVMTAPGQSVCRFCAFADACHFDETMTRDKFKKLRALPDGEVFTRLSAEEEQEHGR